MSTSTSLTPAQFNLLASTTAIPLSWSKVRFYQGTNSSTYCLNGFPASIHTKVSLRLQALGATVHRSGTTGNGAYGYIHFAASHHLAAKLALMFPAPAGYTPLIVTGVASIGKRKGSASIKQFVL